MLSRLLQAKQPLFDRTITQLEAQTHNRSTDAELIAEILEKAHDRMRQLKLDPADTTGKELYRALINQVKDQGNKLAKSIGGKDPNSLEEMIPLLTEEARKADIPRDCWVIKEDVAKQMLLDKPPRQILKRLGYKSAKEMLKNEDIGEIFGAIRFGEDADWLNSFNEQYESLTYQDLEEREIRIINLDYEKWGNLAEHFVEKKLHNVTHSKEMGIIITVPIPPSSPMTGQGITLKVLPLLFHYYNEIRLYSAFFKLMKDKKNFGEIFVSTLIADPAHVPVTQGDNIHWRVIQRYFGKLKDESHPEAFEPHVNPEDLHWRKAEDVLYDIDPDLEFWKDMDYVGLFMNDDEPVTFNMLDVAFSYANDEPFETRYMYHFREALWNEIFIRYLGHKNLEERVLKRLDNDLIAPETITKIR